MLILDKVCQPQSLPWLKRASVGSVIWFLPFFAGPDLPFGLHGHSMVALGLGQAVLGGWSSSGGYQKKIYHITCSEQICMISLLNQELSIPRKDFVAIPIPDSMSGCTSNSEFGYFWKEISLVVTQNAKGSFHKIHHIGSFLNKWWSQNNFPTSLVSTKSL